MGVLRTWTGSAGALVAYEFWEAAADVGNYAKILVEGVSGRAFLSLDEADDLVYNNMENARRHAAVRLGKI